MTASAQIQQTAFSTFLRHLTARALRGCFAQGCNYCHGALMENIILLNIIIINYFPKSSMSVLAHNKRDVFGSILADKERFTHKVCELMKHEK